jgi:hypothetical protein
LLAPKFGTTDQGSIILSSLERKADAEETTLPNGQGDIVEAAYHGMNSEITCEFKVHDTGYPDDALVGGIITITDTELGGTYIVKSVSNTKAQGEFMGGNMTLRRFPSITVMTSTTTTTP